MRILELSLNIHYDFANAMERNFQLQLPEDYDCAEYGVINFDCSSMLSGQLPVPL